MLKPVSINPSSVFWVSDVSLLIKKREFLTFDETRASKSNLLLYVVGVT